MKSNAGVIFSGEGRMPDRSSVAGMWCFGRIDTAVAFLAALAVDYQSTAGVDLLTMAPVWGSATFYHQSACEKNILDRLAIFIKQRSS